MKTALITGGSRGIGKATVMYFLSQGWAVVTTSTTGKVNFSDPKLTCYQLLLGKKESTDKLVENIMNANIKVDCLINNAWWSAGRTQENPIDISLLEKVLNTNLIGTISLTQKLLPFLNNQAKVISISSEFGSLNEDWGFRSPSYRIAKAAINMFTRNYYKNDEVLKKSISVYCFDPGWVKTDMGGVPMHHEIHQNQLKNYLSLQTQTYHLGTFIVA